MDASPLIPPHAANDPYFNPANVHKAAAMVRGPANALIVLAILGILFHLLILTASLINNAPVILDQYDATTAWSLIGGQIVFSLLMIFLHGFIISAAIRMKRLRDYSNAKAAAFISVVPILSPLMLVGVPFGIWALAMIYNSRVSDAFETIAELESTSDASE